MTAPFPLAVRLDWRAYFLEFLEAHGNNPVEHQGRLLFADGWSYSSTDYAGPETPPPDNVIELADLQRVYWTKRRELVRRELARLRPLANLQRSRALPLKHRIGCFVEDAGRMKLKTSTADLAVNEQVELLEADLEHSRTKLDELG